MKPSVPRHRILRARALRKSQTKPERTLWKLLRRRGLYGFKFRRQRPMGPYILDFYCLTARLCVELDGTQHDTPEQRAHDLRRKQFLEKEGIRELRFWNRKVIREPEKVVEEIVRVLLEKEYELAAKKDESLVRPSAPTLALPRKRGREAEIAELW